MGTGVLAPYIRRRRPAN